MIGVNRKQRLVPCESRGNFRLGWQNRGERRAKNIEGATALRPLRPRSIVPLSFLGFPAQSERQTKPRPLSWQENFVISTVESCARLCKKAPSRSNAIELTHRVNLGNPPALGVAWSIGKVPSWQART